MIEQRFPLPFGVKVDRVGPYRDRVVVDREGLDPRGIIVEVLTNKLVNGTDSVPGDLRVNPGNFREYDDYNPQFGSVTDFCVAAGRFAELLGLKLSEVMADLEEVVGRVAAEKESGYKTAFRMRTELKEQLGNLPNDIEHAASDLTRMYGRVLVLRDYVDGRLQDTPRGEKMGRTSFTSRLHGDPTAYELSVQVRLDEIRAGIDKRLRSA